jgi:DNA-directed RNA polymerase specialized sigma subunit
MKNTMTDKTTTHYSELKNRNYTRKVYEMNNSEYYYRPTIHNNHFAMQKTKQVKKIKEDAFYNSDSIENIELIDDTSLINIENAIDTKNFILKYLPLLDNRRRKMLQMQYAICYDKEHTLIEIAEEFCLSLSRISDMIRDAKRKLRYFYYQDEKKTITN